LTKTRSRVSVACAFHSGQLGEDLSCPLKRCDRNRDSRWKSVNHNHSFSLRDLQRKTMIRLHPRTLVVPSRRQTRKCVIFALRFELRRESRSPAAWTYRVPPSLNRNVDNDTVQIYIHNTMRHAEEVCSTSCTFDTFYMNNFKHSSSLRERSHWWRDSRVSLTDGLPNRDSKTIVFSTVQCADLNVQFECRPRN
jgi:hypothetical protein